MRNPQKAKLECTENPSETAHLEVKETAASSVPDCRTTGTAKSAFQDTLLKHVFSLGQGLARSIHGDDTFRAIQAGDELVGGA